MLRACSSSGTEAKGFRIADTLRSLITPSNGDSDDFVDSGWADGGGNIDERTQCAKPCGGRLAGGVWKEHGPEVSEGSALGSS